MLHSTVERPSLPVEAVLAGEVLGPADTVRVVGAPHPFRTATVDAEIRAGLTIAELIREANDGTLPWSCRVTLEMPSAATARLREPIEIDPKWLDRIRPKPGAKVTFRAVPRGGAAGGSPLRMVLMLAIMVVAMIVAPYLAAALVGVAAGTAFTIATAVITMAIVAVGTLLVNMLLPVKPPKVTGERSEQVNFISTARNQGDPWGPIPVIFGRHRVAPRYAALPYTEIVGDDQYLRLLFVPGHGPIEVSDLRIGETPIDSFQGVEMEIRDGYSGDAPITLYPAQVFQENFDILLTGAGPGTGSTPGPWVERTTADDIDEISVDFTMPQGFYRTNDKGSLRTAFVAYQVEYSPAGAGTWVQVVNEAIERQQTSAVRFSHRWVVTPRGQFDVRVRRAVQEEVALNIHNEIRWSALRGLRNDPPVTTTVPLCLIGMRIKASDQLNGVVDTFSLIAEPLLPDWSPTASPPAWIERKTQNPASCFLAVLQGPGNARPLPDSRIDWESLQAWHEHCTDKGFRYNRICDFDNGILDTLTEIATAGRAALTVRDGRWGVIFDVPDQPIVQHFTPRNSWGFSSQRNYREFPHAWRIAFLNEQNDFLPDERPIYDDGYDESNATKFEGLQFQGVTDPDQIWKLGRYHLAQLRLRPEMFTFNADFESLVCTRGDLIRFTHDIPLFGLASGLVKSVDGLAITLDDFVPMLPAEAYAMRFRRADGSSLLFALLTEPGEIRTVTLVDPGTSPLVLPEPGDLWMFGSMGSESVELIVYSIEPTAGLNARVTCVDAAPAIRDADTGVIPPYDSQITAPLDLRGRLPPSDLRFSEALVRAGPTVESRASLSWLAPRVTGAVLYEVQLRAAGDPWPANGVTTSATFHVFTNLPTGTYDFRVRSLGPSNTASDWTVLSGQLLEGLAAAPADVVDFRVGIVGQTATLSWAANTELDVLIGGYYEIRFVAALSGAEWKNGLVLATNIVGTSLQVPALVGTWLIKAYDSSGVSSVNASAVVSSIAELAGLNAVELLDEAAPSPPFAGVGLPSAVNVVYDGALLGLVLDDVDVEASEEDPIEGVYPFAAYPSGTALDLGEVYTSRVTALVAVAGFDTAQDILMADDVLSIVDVLGGEIDEYEVEPQVRWTSDDPTGSPVTWSNWTPFLVTDITARAFEFRAVLRSFLRGITPLVTQLSVTVDMPDRLDSAEDVAVGIGGLTVLFAPPFRKLTGLAFSSQGQATGDYYDLTAKDEMGFTVQFFDDTDTPIATTFDWVARGYGHRGTP